MIDPIVGDHAPPGDPRFTLPLRCSSFYCCLCLPCDCRLLEGGLDFLGRTPGSAVPPWKPAGFLLLVLALSSHQPGS